MTNRTYESYQEIHKSYEAMQAAFEKILHLEQPIREFFEGKDDLLFVASGSSYWMSLSAAGMISYRTGRRADAVKAGDIVMNPEQYKGRFRHPIIIAPSRSGRTRELIEAILQLKEYYPESRIFSVTEYQGNDLAGISDFNIGISEANEISVCQTRSFNCLWTVFVAIAALLAGEQKLKDDMRKFFRHAPGLMEEGEKKVGEMLEVVGCPRAVVTLGSGIQYGLVIEGAYIVTEMAEQLANYYQLMEYRHGPIVTADGDILITICSAGPHAAELERGMGMEAKKNGARVAMVSCGDESGWCDFHFSMKDEYCPEVTALYFVMIQQSLAYQLSIKKGCNPDSPGQLVRFISY